MNTIPTFTYNDDKNFISTQTQPTVTRKPQKRFDFVENQKINKKQDTLSKGETNLLDTCNHEKLPK